MPSLEDEPFVIDTTNREDDGEAESEGDISDEDEDEDDEFNLRERFEGIVNIIANGEFKLSEDNKAEFSGDHKNILFEKTAHEKSNLLHYVVENSKLKDSAKFKALITLLVGSKPALLSEQDTHERTPLWIAVHKKRYKLMHYMCDSYPKIQDVIKITCRSDTCLHEAIRKNIRAKEIEETKYLLERAAPETICAKDSKGLSPLHLAVSYDYCTEEQLSVVEQILKCEAAIDQRTNDSKRLSPYRFHEETRSEAKAKAKAEEDARKEARGKERRKEEEADKDNANRFGGKESAKTRSSIQAFQDMRPSRPQAQDTMTPRPTEFLGTRSRVVTQAQDTRPQKPSKNPKVLETPLPTSSRTVAPDKRVKAEKKAPKVTEESANEIKALLKLHCMRKKNQNDAVEFLYGRRPEKEIFFDLHGYTSTFNEDVFGRCCKFEDILQYVRLPILHLEKKAVSSKFSKASPKPDGKGRSDYVSIFDFLRRKGVTRILRIVVDDMQMPAHSDENIEKALGGFKIEKWDWQRIDLCTETIATAAPEVKEVTLYWSGNNAVLQGWSSQGGLGRLLKLEKVYLHISQGLENEKRTRRNVSDFKKSMRMLRPEVIIEEIKDYQPEQRNATPGPINPPSHEQNEHNNRWLTCMDEFAEFIQNVEVPKHCQDNQEQVVVAVIDDGVDIGDRTLEDKIQGGRTFCQWEDNSSTPYYVTSGGHGTLMASLICRVCPRVKLYVLKLEEHRSEHSTRQITASSAAKAVRAAIYEKVHIISMSWTIEPNEENRQGIRDLELAIEAAATEGILMFCAATDQGLVQNQSYPAASATKKLFKIGAAEPSGAGSKQVGDPAGVDFFFPGEKLVHDRPGETPLNQCKVTLSGSSIATALASGLAALVLYCIQLAALNTNLSDQPVIPGGTRVRIEDFQTMKTYERMNEAFLHAIGTSKAPGASMHKYIEVWNVFAFDKQQLKTPIHDEKVDIVAGVANRLKLTKELKLEKRTY